MNRRKFLSLAVGAALAPVVSKLPALPRQDLTEASLEAAIAEIAKLTDSQAIRIAISPRVLWPGVKAYWDEYYKEQPIHFSELYLDA